MEQPLLSIRHWRTRKSSRSKVSESPTIRSASPRRSIRSLPIRKAYGVAKNFELKVRDIIINNGAEMIVVIMGEIMRMPGLPKDPQAKRIDIVDGVIEGLS